MDEEQPHKSSLDHWWSMRATERDLRDAEFVPQERGVEADERDRRFVQEAFATLSPARDLLVAGALAGLQAGATFVAIASVVLLLLIGANLSIASGSNVGVFGDTPLVGTIFEPLWPVVVATGAIPFFAAVGAVSALMRRLNLRLRHALDHYFEPIRPILDLLTFWLLTAVLIHWSLGALGLTGPASDTLGVAVLAASIGGIIAWPLYSVWERQYLAQIRRRGSASLDEIKALIYRQI
jgi:hypothetical protein